MYLGAIRRYINTLPFLFLSFPVWSMTSFASYLVLSLLVLTVHSTFQGCPAFKNTALAVPTKSFLLPSLG